MFEKIKVWVMENKTAAIAVGVVVVLVAVLGFRKGGWFRKSTTRR